MGQRVQPDCRTGIPSLALVQEPWRWERASSGQRRGGAGAKGPSNHTLGHSPLSEEVSPCGVTEPCTAESVSGLNPALGRVGSVDWCVTWPPGAAGALL